MDLRVVLLRQIFRNKEIVLTLPKENFQPWLVFHFFLFIYLRPFHCFPRKVRQTILLPTLRTEKRVRRHDLSFVSSGSRWYLSSKPHMADNKTKSNEIILTRLESSITSETKEDFTQRWHVFTQTEVQIRIINRRYESITSKIVHVLIMTVGHINMLA